MGQNVIAQIRPAVSIGDNVHKFGFNPDVDAFTGGDEDIVAWGGLQFWPTSVVAAADIDIVSSSTQDVSGGTGAASITIQGLDANYKLQSETINLNGQTDVHPTKDYIRIFRAYCNAVGTNGANVGTITIDNGAGGVLSSILAGFGQTTQATYTIPADYRYGWLTDFDVTIASKNSVTGQFYLYTRVGAGHAWRVTHVFNGSSSGGYDHEYHMPIQLTPRTDIRITCFDASADNLPVSASFAIYLER